ncbi:hypothetical protein M5D96_009274 [Drosophila gunungcola]|uniref:tRNA-intron lyase n=1 Tax=Drosophila gunungcola TaxID=103775 RepID=A0A9P9YIU9_9MUSC|nr:hypothetical protein M5D96_009274 [Drosophila gunungcola]
MFLTLLNGTGFVFNVDDYMELRSKHRIMGAPVGTANTKGWSPNQSTAALTAQDVLKEMSDNFKFDRQNALVEVPCEHLKKHSAKLVTGPLVNINSLKYRIFKDLWMRGNFVTSGDAFGADFLVYPGDPLIYHASHIVIVQDAPLIKPLELVAKFRESSAPSSKKKKQQRE